MWSLISKKVKWRIWKVQGDGGKSITTEACPGYGGLNARGKYIGQVDRAEDLAFSMIGEEAGGSTVGLGNGGSVGGWSGMVASKFGGMCPFTLCVGGTRSRSSLCQMASG